MIDRKLIPTKTTRHIDIKKMSPKDIYKVFLLPNRKATQYFFTHEIKQILSRIDNDGNLKTKRCSRCYVIKPVSDFWVMNSSSKDNIRYSSRCKLCAKKKPIEYKRKKSAISLSQKKPKLLCRIGNYVEYNNIIMFCNCTKCNLVKPISDFYRYKRSFTGYCGHCKVCEMKYRKGSSKGNKYERVI